MKVLPSILTIALLFSSAISIAQYDQGNRSLVEKFDQITVDWLHHSEELIDYSGIREYCLVPSVRSSVDNLIREIHHYDSLILGQLNDPTVYLTASKKEQKKTYKDLYEMEMEYSYAEFHKKMADVCDYRKEIERNADKLKNGMGDNSYDTKVLMLELEVGKYMKHLDKLTRRIDEHLHLISFETVQGD